MPDESPRKGRRGWLLGCSCGAAFGLVLLVIAISVAMSRGSAAETEALVAEIEARGEPLAPARLAPPLASDEENAAPLYVQAFAALVKPPAELEEAIANWEEGIAPAPDAAALDDHLAQNAACLARLAEGARRPRCRFDVDYRAGFEMRLDHLMHFRSAASLLRLKARRLAELGRPDEALDALGLGYRVQRGLAEEPLLISHLVRIAGEATLHAALAPVLERSEPSEAACRGLIATLDEIRKGDELARVFVGERCIGFDVLARIPHGTDAFSTGHGYERWVPTLMRWGWLLNKNKLTYLKTMTREVEIVRSLGPRSLAEAQALNAEIEGLSPVHFLAKMLPPTVSGTVEKHQGSEAARAVARATLALRIVRLRRGAHPDTLEPLSPAVLPSVPLDPFTGGPLVYRKAGAGFVLYSVGPNGRDDGGPGPGNMTGSAAPSDDVGMSVGR